MIGLYMDQIADSADFSCKIRIFDLNYLIIYFNASQRLIMSIRKGENGMLDERSYVELNGFKQKIHIRTNDETKSVLLFLHGGPGVCNRHTVLLDHADLMDTFTIVGWDQRGSGGSYAGVKKETLTVDQLVEDARALTEYLCKRFHKDKIFVIGGSWGSELGTYLLNRYPEHVAAFVGFGQVVDGAENERISYEFALNAAKEAGDVKSVRILEELGAPVKGCYKGGYKGMMKQRNIMMKYGGYSPSAKKRSYSSSMVKPMLLSGEYTVKDILGLIIGHKVVLETMWAEVGATDFKKTCTVFKAPIYIFDGKLDQNTPSVLVEDWFNMIEAPEKELVWFENSGHNPMNDEGDAFKKLLREKLTAVKDRETAVV